MNKSVACLVLLAVSPLTQAFGIVKPGWERPIKRAEMKVMDARFFDVKDVTLTLTKRDLGKKAARPALPYTGMVLEYTLNRVENDRDAVQMIQPQHVKQVLVVDAEPTRDECGTTVIYGHLADQLTGKAAGARFSVVLEDHSTRLCEDYKPNLWEARVRQGFGFCGTMDATMELAGNPEPVYTIQNADADVITDIVGTDQDEFTTELNIIRN